MALEVDPRCSGMGDTPRQFWRLKFHTSAETNAYFMTEFGPQHPAPLVGSLLVQRYSSALDIRADNLDRTADVRLSVPGLQQGSRAVSRADALTQKYTRPFTFSSFQQNSWTARGRWPEIYNLQLPPSIHKGRYKIIYAQSKVVLWSPIRSPVGSGRGYSLSQWRLISVRSNILQA